MRTPRAVIFAFTASILAGCGDPQACELPDEARCIEFGSFEPSATESFTDCVEANGVDREGTCADVGYPCAGEHDGEFLPEGSC
jgi:hypothetical protein